MSSQNSLSESSGFPRSPRSRVTSTHTPRKSSLLGAGPPQPTTQTSLDHSYFTASPGSEQRSNQSQSSISTPKVRISSAANLSPGGTTWESPMSSATRSRKNSEVSLGSQKKGHPMLMAAIEAAKAPFERRRSMSGNSSTDVSLNNHPAVTTLLDAQHRDDTQQKKIDEKAARKLQKSQSSRIARRLSIGGAGSDSEGSLSDGGSKPRRFRTLSRVFSYGKKKNSDHTRSGSEGSGNSSTPDIVVSTSTEALNKATPNGDDGLMSAVEEEPSRAVSLTPEPTDATVHLESPLASPAPNAYFHEVSPTAYAGPSATSVEGKEPVEAKEETLASEVPAVSSTLSQGSWIHISSTDDVTAASTNEVRDGKSKLHIIDDEEDGGSFADDDGSAGDQLANAKSPSLLSSMKERSRSLSPNRVADQASSTNELPLSTPIVAPMSTSLKGKEVIRTSIPNDFTPPMTPSSTKFPDAESKSSEIRSEKPLSAPESTPKVDEPTRTPAPIGSYPDVEKTSEKSLSTFSHPLLDKEVETRKTTPSTSLPSNRVEFSDYLPSRETVDTAAQYATPGSKNEGSRVDSDRRHSAVSSVNYATNRISVISTGTSTINSQDGFAPSINLRHSQSQPLKAHSSRYGEWYHGTREPTVAEELYPIYPSYRRQRVESAASSSSASTNTSELVRRSSGAYNRDLGLPFVPSWIPLPYIVIWSWRTFISTAEFGLGVAIITTGAATGMFRFGVDLGLGLARFGLGTAAHAATMARRMVGL